jgi:hypothetical protein
MRSSGLTAFPAILLAALSGCLVIATAAACATGSRLAGDATIPDSVMLGTDDFHGVDPAEGGPDVAVHPLPPWPCGRPAATSQGAQRTINAAFGRYHAYEYVARYPAGLAQAAVEALREQLSQCSSPAAGERYQIVAGEAGGVLFLRDFDAESKTDAYFVAAAGEYLIAVVEVGTGDPTTALDLGHRAVERAGSTPGTPTPPEAPTRNAKWATYEAEVTGVRRGPDDRSLYVDIQHSAGHPDCARNPKISSYTEENNRIHANVVLESARAHVVGGCPTKASTVVTLRSKTSIGDREIVLNQRRWVRDGSGYQPA